uniref:Bm987 n=1 Tax=Brugia malayi TaxID=6279 RepID=A0A1I9G5Y7_BRUMA|nr:Bm987 [Brugia malayi]
MLLFHCSSVETFVSRDNSLLKLDDHLYINKKKKNKSSNQRISLNRSQYGGCSTAYNTLTSNQVVCK